MKKVNVKEVKRLIEEVISNAIKILASGDDAPFVSKEDLVRKLSSEPLAITYKRFVAPTSKKVKVIVEREYSRKYRDDCNTILVLVDDKPELFVPSTFVFRVIDAI